MILGHQLDTQRVDSLLSEAEFIIAHNAYFCREFLGRVSRVAESKPWRCSMKEIDWSKYPSAALWRLLYSHRISRPKARTAIDDVRCTLHLLNMLDALGNPYFLQLIKGR